MTWTPGLQLLVLGLIMVVLMSAGWAWQRRWRNTGIVDAVWAAGVGLGAILMAVTGSGGTPPRLLLGGLGAVWAARLAWLIARRLRQDPHREDGRYRALREHWQDNQLKLYGLFLAQAFLVVMFALPFVAVAANPVATFTPVLWLGVAIWVIAVAGETWADAQLAAFRSVPAHRGRTCRQGLWRYSRHPNYFFEWLHWFAYVALAWGSPWFWLAGMGPLVMYVFLRWISGIPYTEAQALRTRGDDYRRYQQETPMLIPWPVRRRSSSPPPPTP